MIMQKHKNRLQKNKKESLQQRLYATELVLSHLHQHNHILLTDKILYYNQDSNQWQIDDLEQRPVFITKNMKEAASYFAMLETPELIIDVFETQSL